MSQALLSPITFVIFLELFCIFSNYFFWSTHFVTHCLFHRKLARIFTKCRKNFTVIELALQGYKGCGVKVISLLEAYFDLISGFSLHMKIQIMAGKFLKIWGSNPRPRRSKFTCPFFFSFSNSP